jgi:predicted Rossmann fold flavoprotein
MASAPAASERASGGPTAADVVIVGAGAAGLATAIFTGRAASGLRVLVLDGARKPGAKILVSGGSRCNVTNTVVTEADFNGGRPSLIRRILRGLSVAETIRFFQTLGIELREEPGGKLFPVSNRARDVLDALLRGTAAVNASVLPEHRVTEIERHAGGFLIHSSRGDFRASRIVLATGGQSLPKSGSDGAGYAFARGLGHTIVPTTPALAPLVLHDTGNCSIHGELSGVSHDVRLDLWINGRRQTQVGGSLLWTHFGLSGPAALDASRHWLRARLEGDNARLTASFLPDDTFDGLDRRWQQLAVERPRASVPTVLATMIPASVAAAVWNRVGLEGERVLAELARDDRRRLVHALTEWPLAVRDSRGYNYAEATAGGVALTEIDPATMESRVCPGLFLVGEILDVDGRLGGFNFQWAWSSARVAARGLTRGVQR